MAKKEKVKKGKGKVTKEEVVTKKAKKGKKVRDEDEEEGGSVKVDVADIYGNMMDDIARAQDFEADTMEDVPPMSTGMLALDLIHGGGIRPAWYTHFGPEQSAKTTGALTIMANAIKAKVPIIDFSDYEGSTKNSKPYVSAILKTAGLKLKATDVFGKKDPTTGKYIVRPVVRYRPATVGEKFFDYLAEVLRKLPDKKKIGAKWWFVFEDNKVNKAKYGEVSVPSMSKKYGKGIWVEAPDGNLQGIFLVDSYPGMNPSSNDEEDSDNSLALQARMFSKHIPRVKGRLAQKMVAVLGINQLRKIPMARYGPDEMEPCGQALRYNSDCRLRFYPRALSGVKFGWPKDHPETKGTEGEKSITGGTDTYRYIHVSATKNKMWTPGREGWIRIWVEDGQGVARGFDPFYDTVYYLRQTGQLSGKNRKSLTLKLEGLGEAKKGLSWLELKEWVLGDKDAKITMSQKCGYKPMDLRSFCFKQMRDGIADRLYVELKGIGKKGEEDDDDGGSED